MHKSKTPLSHYLLIHYNLLRSNNRFVSKAKVNLLTLEQMNCTASLHYNKNIRRIMQANATLSTFHFLRFLTIAVELAEKHQV